MIQIEALPAFVDNYIWLLHNGKQAVLVDPGDGAVAEAALRQKNLTLSAILITHWHPDHIGGLPLLCKQHDVPVYGPAAEQAHIPQLSHALGDGDRVQIEQLALDLQVIAVPGHTLGHIAFYQPGLLLCGDTLFSGGCGRLFEGTPAQMQQSLEKLAALPADTPVYCTHEYTQANLKFAQAVEPDNQQLQDYARQVAQWRAQDQISLPSSIAREQQINPFLRWAEPAVIAAAQAQGASSSAPAEVFAAIRAWKDRY